MSPIPWAAPTARQDAVGCRRAGDSPILIPPPTLCDGAATILYLPREVAAARGECEPTPSAMTGVGGREWAYELHGGD